MKISIIIFNVLIFSSFFLNRKYIIEEEKNVRYFSFLLIEDYDNIILKMIQQICSFSSLFNKDKYNYHLIINIIFNYFPFI